MEHDTGEQTGGSIVIYLDNAATTLRKPPQVARAVLDAMENMGNSARGAHKSSLDASRTIYGAREKLASLFRCSRADHVVFTGNATEALNIAINGLIGPGDHVISTDLEHNSVLRPLYRLEAERDVRLSFAAADRQGNLDYEDFRRLLRPDTRAIVCAHASNLTGNLTDVARIADIARGNGVLLIVDAAQTAGTRPVDMEALGADVLCFSGHKGLLGPQGTGGMCIREGVSIRPFKVGGTGVQTYSREHPSALPTRLEAGTLNGHGIAGLSAAVDYLNEVGIARILQKETALAGRFYRGVRDIPCVTVYGDYSRDRSAIVTLNLGDRDSSQVAEELWERYEIAVRAGAHCAPRMHEALGTREWGAVRFSFSWFNTEEEVDMALSALREMAEE